MWLTGKVLPKLCVQTHTHFEPSDSLTFDSFRCDSLYIVCYVLRDNAYVRCVYVCVIMITVIICMHASQPANFNSIERFVYVHKT